MSFEKFLRKDGGRAVDGVGEDGGRLVRIDVWTGSFPQSRWLSHGSGHRGKRCGPCGEDL